MSNSISLSKIAQSVIKEYETDEINADLEREMKAALSKITSSAKSVKVEKENIEVESEENGELQEALDPVSWIGIILAAPKVVELLTKAFSTLLSKINKYFKKGNQPTDNETEIAKTIISFTHKWHSAYVKVLQYILEATGCFRKANITDSADKKRASEMLYYIIVAGLATYSGVGAAKAFKAAMASKDITTAASSFNLAAIESAMAAIKSGEVKAFLSKVMM